MPTSITASSSQMLGTIQVPLDGVDNVAQASVSPGYQGILNNTYYLAKSICYQKPNVNIIWTSASSITVNNFSGVWVSAVTPAEQFVYLQSTGPILVNAANIEGGGGFANNTTYYIYASGSGLPASPIIQLSTTAPDVFLTFKGTDESHRYIGHIATTSGGSIYPFRMVNWTYFINPVLLGSLNTTNTVLSATAAYSLPAAFPAAKDITLKFDISTQEPNSSFLNIQPTSVSPVTTFTFSRLGGVGTLSQFSYGLSTWTNPTITATLLSGGTAPTAGAIQLDTYAVGYQE